ncbi:hypothetical protein LSCM4_01576 [Leishmania orientalis]|uniref:Enriched in surface-labeled proteome protein 9 n=1 Tax=Leishmania orientalis TaxID=2249476 RepID=A0A836GJ56_9TRYP|nr:hypothetical protein LSCM4_01576 [Leishmania orientalis]
MARACRSAAMAKHVAAAALLALLSVSVAVSAVSLLPLSGWQTMDVELVCRTAATNRPTVHSNPIVSAFRFTTPWKVAVPLDFTVVPLYVDRLLDDDFVRTYYISATEKFTVSDSGGCVHATGLFDSDDEVLVAQVLANVLGTPLPLTYNSSVNRGIDANVFSSSFDLFIPIDLGGLGMVASYSVDVVTTVPGWTVNLVPVEQTVLSVELSAVMGVSFNNCLFTVSFLSSQVFDAPTLVPPSSCKRASSSSIRSLVAQPVSAARSSLQAVAGVAGAPALSLNASANSSVSASPSLSLSSVPPEDINPTMPDLPGEFTADFFVISPNHKSILEVREAFSPDGGISYARVLLPVSSPRRHAYLYEWFVDAYNQMVYFSTKYIQPERKKTLRETFRDLFTPVKDTCQRVLIGYDLMAGSVRSLLLYSQSVPPTFIGNQTVRNVPCGVWTVQANGFRVTWFWATSSYVDTTSFHTSESVRSGASAYSKLMRMTVEMRKGAPPLFPHHPFFQQPYAFPLADRSMACGVLGPGEGNVGCNDNHTGDNFLYIYDIATFVPYVRREDYTIPKACNGTMISDSIPSAVCHLTGITSGVEAMLLVVIALLFALVSGCCVWCHFSRTMRHQQDQLARLTWEIHLVQSTNETDGQDTTIVSATGFGDLKNSSS